MPTAPSNFQMELVIEVQRQKALLDDTHELFNRLGLQPMLKLLLVGPVFDFCFALGPQDDRLREAFEYCGLDSRDPRHWRLLASSFAAITFKKPGAGVKWDQWSLARLYLQSKELRKKRPELTSNSQIADALMRDRSFRDQFGVLKTGTLSKLLSQSADPTLKPYIGLLDGQQSPQDLLESVTGVNGEVAQFALDIANERFVTDEILPGLQEFWKAKYGKTWSGAVEAQMIARLKDELNENF